jgi:hypothetical protein
MTRGVLVFAATTLVFAAGANAQTYSRMPNAGAPAATPAPQQSSQATPARAIDASISASSVDLASVPDPLQTLTNLTVYARGVDIGHVARVSLDSSGRPDRVLIAFNSDTAPAWVGAGDVRYDPQKRQITTSMSPGSMQNLSAMRIR